LNKIPHTTLSLPSLDTLTLKEKIGQMIVVRASGHLFDHQRRYPTWEASNSQLKYWLEELKLGGVILLGGSAAEVSLRTQKLQQWAQIPLLLAADIEEGVGQRFVGATWFPPPMNLGAISPAEPKLAQEYAANMGAIIAQEALAIGLNWILAPIVDVNNNPDNPVINIRAFSDDPILVGTLAESFIQGTQSYPILTTAKHFPGHGDTATDSHLDLPVILHGGDRLIKVELPPFQQAIQAGVDSVMTAHLMIPAWDTQKPATLSPAILTGQLRENLGFEGLIVTDALIMGGITKYASLAEISVSAIAAGADILLMPQDPEVVINSVVEAVLAGRITETRIDQSLQRIWRAKQKIQPISINLDSLAQETSIQLVINILEKGMQRSLNVPIQPPVSSVKPLNLIVIDDLLKNDFLTSSSPALTLPHQLGYHTLVTEQNQLPDNVGDIGLLQLFSRGNPFRGTAGLNPNTKQWLQQRLANSSIQALIIYGSPYIKDWLTAEINIKIPWVFIFGQMDLAQTIALHNLLIVSGFSDLSRENFM
jgi:beta-glucosidase